MGSVFGRRWLFRSLLGVCLLVSITSGAPLASATRPVIASSSWSLRAHVGAWLWHALGRSVVASLEPWRDAMPRRLLGQSFGFAFQGALVHASQMPPGDGYHLRHPDRTFGTEATVRHLLRAIEVVRQHDPSLHRLAIGDLSTRDGGRLQGHRTHQSGRDVDLGFYYRRPSPGYPHEFVSATEQNLDLAATWQLIRALADTRQRPDGVDYILLDYEVQRWLYEYAKDSGFAEAELAEVFQFPRGRRADVGVVRHYDKHLNHLHVRFKCPPLDMFCV